MGVTFRAFDHAEDAEQFLADDITRRLGEAIAARDAAVLVAAGGSTPVGLYQELATRPLAWDRVSVLPSDARWLPGTDPASNEGLIRRTLLQDQAAAAWFYPLYLPIVSPAQAVADARMVIDGLPPPDVVLLGMGEDGHTASWFPGAPELPAALDPHGPPVLALEAPGALATAQRLTLTLSVFLQASAIRVLMFGARKRAVFEAAMQPGSVEALPIRALLYQDRVPVEVVWAP